MGTWSSQHCVLQKQSLSLPRLQVDTEQRKYGCPHSMGALQVTHLEKILSLMGTQRVPSLLNLHQHCFMGLPMEQLLRARSVTAA